MFIHAIAIFHGVSLVSDGFPGSERCSEEDGPSAAGSGCQLSTGAQPATSGVPTGSFGATVYSMRCMFQGDSTEPPIVGADLALFTVVGDGALSRLFHRFSVVGD